MSSCFIKRLCLSDNLQKLKDETRCSPLFSLFLSGVLPPPLLCCLSNLLANQHTKLAESYPVFVAADLVSHILRVRSWWRSRELCLLLRKKIEGPLHALPLSLHISSAVLWCLLRLKSNVCLFLFCLFVCFQTTRKISPKCKCTHVNILASF